MRKLFKHILVEKTDHLPVQFLRYFGVVGLCFAVDFSVLYVLTDLLGIHYFISSAASYCVGMAVNYILSVLWVFKTRKYGSRAVEFGLFSTIGLAGLAVNQLLMWLLTSPAGLHYMKSRLISAVIGYFWKFFARRQTLFAPPKDPGRP